jgi:hypothetical protein
MSVPEFRQEAAAAFEARKELGPDYERAIVDSFVAGAAASIREQVDARLAEHGVGRTPQKRQAGDPQFRLAIWSLVIGFFGSGGLTAGANQGPLALVVLWAGIAAVNFAFALRQRPR